MSRTNPRAVAYPRGALGNDLTAPRVECCWLASCRLQFASDRTQRRDEIGVSPEVLQFTALGKHRRVVSKADAQRAAFVCHPGRSTPPIHDKLVDREQAGDGVPPPTRG